MTGSLTLEAAGTDRVPRWGILHMPAAARDSAFPIIVLALLGVWPWSRRSARGEPAVGGEVLR